MHVFTANYGGSGEPLKTYSLNLIQPDLVKL